MRLGLWLTPQHLPEIAPTRAVQQHIEQVTLARDFGFDLALAGQHFLSDPYWMLQNLPLLARLVAEAGTMRLGTGITLITLLNPLEVAENAATMSVLASGRFVLGVGQGYRAVEYNAFGVGSGRGQAFEQKLDTVRRLLAGEYVSATGPGFSLERARLGLLPEEPVPIWIAANNDKGVRRAARLGDAWLINPHSSLQQLARQIQLFHETRAAAGLPEVSAVPAAREVCVRPTDAEAIEIARPYIERKYAVYLNWGQDATMPAGDTLDRDWDTLTGNGRFIVGSPGRCAALIREHIDRLGVTDFICRFQWPGMPQKEVLRSMELLVSDVLHRV